ncbi:MULTISPECIES: ATP-binding cassette ATPase Uup [Alteromonas]|uniref:ATP-binding protein Uup n=1 Tax=Alteromonas stellipolaris TaxID=233316 RepID=A0ABN4LL32_9ALTE|nr:ABC transporter ATP-binding protein [Alteromonas stellipolaris]ALM90559.1 ABC transporter ATP-binding protein uup [Alteromonas stellipolaris LMG 21856]AMJ73622.1 ABC transporter ATP-binding protein [Alteromonas stellipolaris]ANB27287.1 ABC transporter ATP-binding protein [Alteromonas stellipolaris]MBZ2162369.1 ABC transporter ATP-binding protein [Alteromonas stellipolaris]MDO6533910.1 ABC transporter ATP-binding protein [Alteromonas stellipolaris]
MSILQLKNITVIYGNPPLLDGVELIVQPKERVCLVGRNGSGKSTLMKVISGDVIADDGQRIIESDTIIARLEQDPPQTTDVTLFDYVAEGLADVGDTIKAYHHQTKLVAEDPSEANLNRLQTLQETLEARDAWQFEQQIEQTLTMLKLEPDISLSTLSGGWRRKAALARALVRSPDLLLLDEPTNHLDIEMIRWLESSLSNYNGAIVFVSHDRAFIRNMATRIVDLDRGGLTSYPGNYETYLEKKQQDLEVEAAHNAEFDKKLAQEEVWIRQGIKARRTRNEGRVRALKKLRDERKARRAVQGNAVVNQHQGARSGKMVFEVTDLDYAIGGNQIVKGLNLNVLRGDKLALVGPNGSGKSTLIKLLLGELTPDKGNCKQGTNLEVAYFDQHRHGLDLEQTVIDAVGDGKRDLMVNGHPRHVISYLQDYLFSPERVNAPVKSLSGGEKNRLMLAKLMLKPSNLLVLDEPTNDLDVETLEMLETLLNEYAGTVLLVSHDREFVDNVANSCVVFEGEGFLREFIGGFTDVESWYKDQNAKRQQVIKDEKAKVKNETNLSSNSPSAKSSPRKTKKLSYKDQRELESLPADIEQYENELAEMQLLVNDPEFFKKGNDETAKTLALLAEKEQALSQKYARWDELESMLEDNQQ